MEGEKDIRNLQSRVELYVASNRERKRNALSAASPGTTVAQPHRLDSFHGL